MKLICNAYSHFALNSYRWVFLFYFFLRFVHKGPELLVNCNATYSGFPSHVDHLQAYANDLIIRSFDHLLLAVNFGTYVHNRPGFEKTFRGLSDSAWSKGIGMIKHITKRGGAHNFNVASPRTNATLELSEIHALGHALDIEKWLATKAHHLHESYSHANHRTTYDAEVCNNLFHCLSEPNIVWNRILILFIRFSDRTLYRRRIHRRTSWHCSPTCRTYYRFEGFVVRRYQPTIGIVHVRRILAKTIKCHIATS